jgi:hypothetical protein
MVKPIGPRALEIHRRNAAQACLRGRAVQAGFTVTHLDKSGMWWPSHSRTVPTLSPPPRCYCTSHMADAHSQIAQTQLRCSHAQASCTQPPTRHDAEAQPLPLAMTPRRSQSASFVRQIAQPWASNPPSKLRAKICSTCDSPSTISGSEATAGAERL